MNVTPFPAPNGLVQPIVEILTPREKGGLWEVVIWKNPDRDEGHTVQVPTLEAAMKVLCMVKNTYEVAAHG